MSRARKPLLVIITGPPCSGKTTLARQVAEELRFPLVSRDDIKESLFDSLGWVDREWSRRLGRASYRLLFHFMECQLRAGRSFIVESNFDPELATEEFLDLRRRYAFEPFQVHCRADRDVLFQRFKRRAESGKRHLGHVDHLNYDEFRARLGQDRHDVLPLGGEIREIDTTDFSTVDYEALFAAIRAVRSDL